MNKINVNFGLAIVLILVAVSTRILPHPQNFTAIGAMALFGSAYFSKKNLAMLIPFLALFLSDIFLNYIKYDVGFGWWSLATYLSFGLAFLVGTVILKQVNVKNVFLGSLGVSVVFFLVSNAISWLFDPIYSKDFNGLMTSLIAGIPFFQNELAANLLYSALMFGVYTFSVKQIESAKI